MDFIFEGSKDLSLILSVDNKRYNLGYTHTGKLPLMFWLGAMQISGDNLFNKIEDPKIRGNLYNNSLEKAIEDTKYIASSLPLDRDKFNAKIRSAGLSNFKDGNARTVYEILLGKDGDAEKLNLHCFVSQKVTDLISFSPGDLKGIMEAYFSFIKRHKGFKTRSLEVMSAYTCLKDYRINQRVIPQAKNSLV